MSTQQELIVKLTKISTQQDKARSLVKSLSAELERYEGSGNNVIKDMIALAKKRSKVEYELRSIGLTLQILSQEELEIRNELFNLFDSGLEKCG